MSVFILAFLGTLWYNNAMPSCSKATNPRNVEITFTEHDHRYTSIIDGKEIEYISGTTFIGKFFPPFDPSGRITAACARKRGITVESMKEEWRLNAKAACDFGTKVHERVEDCLLGRALRNTPSNDREKITLANAEKMAKRLLEKFDIVAVEKILFDERLKIAGTADILARSKKDGKFWILDNKTNKKIETENKYKNFGYEPIRHIPGINLAEYGLQLALYEFILKYAGYIDKDEPVGRALLHITEKGVKSYNLPSYQKEIKDMIDFYMNGGFEKK